MLVLVFAAMAAAWWWQTRTVAAPVRTRPVPTAPSAANGSTLHFEPGAPQLAFIRSEAAQQRPEPLVESLPGRIVYDEDRTTRIAAPLPGRVLRIEVQLGDRVAKGAVLAVIDAPDYAQAVADAHRGELEVLQKRRIYERAKLLIEADVMSQREFEAAETELHESEVELSRAHQRLAAFGIGAADGSLQLRSPVAGVVTERGIGPGAQVGPDSEHPLFVVSDPERLWVLVDLPEQRLGVFGNGTSAQIEVDAYPGRQFKATVTHVGDVVDPTTRRVQVRCRVANPDRALKPEMFARVTPVDAEGIARVRVPSGALVTVGLASYVFVERAPGVYERRRVTVSVQGRGEAWLADGVVPGERVVNTGALMLNAELSGA